MFLTLLMNMKCEPCVHIAKIHASMHNLQNDMYFCQIGAAFKVENQNEDLTTVVC